MYLLMYVIVAEINLDNHKFNYVNVFQYPRCTITANDKDIFRLIDKLLINSQIKVIVLVENVLMHQEKLQCILI